MNSRNRAHRALRSAAVAVLVSGGAVLLLGAPAIAHGDGHHDVEIKQYMFMPMTLDIEQGETVTWTNQDVAAHDITVTAGPLRFHSPLLAQGKSWSHTFAAPGSYSYICSVHPEMKATIVVAAAAPVPRPTASALPSHTAPSPARASAQGGATPGTGNAGGDHTKAQPITSVKPQAPATGPTLVSAPQSSATLQPLILVVGAAVGVVMFCLLLMASRPVLVEDAELLRPEPKHLEET